MSWMPIQHSGQLTELAERRLRKILKILARTRVHVGLLLVTDLRMKGLNQKHRGKNQTTDVLSFPTPELFQSQGLLGDLVISKPVLARQAREQGHPIEVELDVLLVHGVLHLMGYDHEQGPKEFQRMLRKERAVLKALGREVETGLMQRSHSG